MCRAAGSFGWAFRCPASGTGPSPPHQIVGPFWISVASVYRARTIDLQGPPSIDDQFGVRMIIYPEPKLAGRADLGAGAQRGNRQCRSLADAQAQQQSSGHSCGDDGAGDVDERCQREWVRGNRTIETQLSYPEHAGDKIALLKGEVDVLISADIQQYVVDDVLGSQKVTNPLKKLHRAGDGCPQRQFK